jgi:triacylglycerol lipase
MQKPAPVYSIDLVLHPARDNTYVHFQNAALHPFEANPSELSRRNIWWLADAALLTYWAPPDAAAVFAAAGLQSTFLKNGSTDCYLAWTSDAVIVAFRGTEPDEWDDMLTNVKVELVRWPNGRVHRGFKEAVDAIWTTLEPKLTGLAQGRTVWFCGHSLGGAVASLAADRYAAPRGVCTFGCPRVGDQTFAQSFNAKLSGRTLRYVNHHDVITHVPPPLGYHHVEVARFIAPNGTVSGTPPSMLHFFSELMGQPESLLPTINGLLNGTQRIPPNFLLEHMPKAYAIWAWNDYDANG